MPHQLNVFFMHISWNSIFLHFEKMKKKKILKLKITAIFFYQFVLNILYITDYMIYRYERVFIRWKYEFK